jgi:HlyD family secretion protein
MVMPVMKWRRWLERLVVVAAILVAVGAALWFFVLRPPPVPVTVHPVGRGTVEETVTNSKAGTVKAGRRSKMSPETGGRVAFIGARAGDRVRRGAVLLRLNDGDLRAALALAEQDLATARAAAREACLTADLAARELQRNLDLERDRIVSESALDRLRSDRDATAARCDAARAAVERARAAIDLARANLRKAVLLAPFDGLIAELKAEVGEWVTPSPPGVPIPPIFDIIDPTSIYVSAPMDEVDAARVAPGLPARVTLDPFPDRTFKGEVRRVAPYVLDIEQQNRTLEVEVEFEDTGFARTVLPGTSADVEIILKTVPGVLRIPSYALLEGERVLVVNGGTLAARHVRIGMRNWEFAEVLEGLDEGEPVVVSLDRAEVREGARAVVRGAMDGTPK